MTVLRPWIDGKHAGEHCAVGDRVDVRWKDGVNTGHEYALGSKGEPGFILNNHDTPVWVPMKAVQFRKIPGSKKRVSVSINPRPRRDRYGT